MTTSLHLDSQRQRYYLRSTAGFSLFELLVVVAIISIMTSFLMASIKSSYVSLSSEGNAITDLVSLAQQDALVENRATALVLAQTTDGRQALALYSLDPVSNSWNAVTPWKFLASGVAIDTTTSTTKSSFVTSSDSVQPPLQNAITTLNGKPVQSVYDQVFLPNGQLHGSSTSFPNLQLFEGTLVNGQIQYLHKSSSSSTSPDYYNILINPSTGRSIVERP